MSIVLVVQCSKPPSDPKDNYEDDHHHHHHHHHHIAVDEKDDYHHHIAVDEKDDYSTLIVTVPIPLIRLYGPHYYYYKSLLCW
jgi:hypothetical protein